MQYFIDKGNEMDEQLKKKVIFTLQTLLKVENIEIIYCTLESLIEELEEDCNDNGQN